MPGKIIALVAPTRSGKTFLAKKLAAHYGGHAILEAPDEFPAWITSALADGSRALASWVFFRNRGIQMGLEAENIKNPGKPIFLDATWLSNYPYVAYHRGDEFENAMMKQITEIDLQTLPWPDALIIISIDDATSEKLWRSSNKSFERGAAYFQDRVIPLKRAFEEYISGLALQCPAIYVDRSGLDWDDPVTFKSIVDRVDTLLND